MHEHERLAAGQLRTTGAVSQLSRKAHGRAARWQHSRTIIMHGPDYLIAQPASSREGWGLERAMKGLELSEGAGIAGDGRAEKAPVGSI